jgi:hypothetical protein
MENALAKLAIDAISHLFLATEFELLGTGIAEESILTYSNFYVLYY